MWCVVLRIGSAAYWLTAGVRMSVSMHRLSHGRRYPASSLSPRNWRTHYSSYFCFRLHEEIDPILSDFENRMTAGQDMSVKRVEYATSFFHQVGHSTMWYIKKGYHSRLYSSCTNGVIFVQKAV